MYNLYIRWDIIMQVSFEKTTCLIETLIPNEVKVDPQSIFKTKLPHLSDLKIAILNCGVLIKKTATLK